MSIATQKEDIEEACWYAVFCDRTFNYSMQWALIAQLDDGGLSALSHQKALTAPVLQKAWGCLQKKNVCKQAGYEHFRASGGRVVHPSSARYPKGYLEVAHAYPKMLPALLVVKGCIAALENAKKIAVVGSRQGAEVCLKKSKKIAQYLAKEGYTILSGYARGVDTYAHLGALSGGGITMMVLPHPLKNTSKSLLPVYLRSVLRDNLSIEKIVEKSLWISQFSPTQRYTRYTPLYRNKVLCALSNAVVVVCATRGSGSYQAAKEAGKMMKPVFVWKPKKNYPLGNQLLVEKYRAVPFASEETLLRLVENTQRVTSHGSS